MRTKRRSVLLLVALVMVLVFNFLLVYSVWSNHGSLMPLLSSQLSFVLFLFLSYICTKRSDRCFFQRLADEINKMINQEIFQERETFEHTYSSRLYHQLYRFYDILLSNQRAVTIEKEKLQSFISDISHQIKTPIANLKLLNSTLLQEPELTEFLHKYLFLQEKQIDKMDFLIQSLVKISRLENGIIQFQPRAASMNDTILQALEITIVKSEQKKVDIYFDNNLTYNVFHDVKWTTEAIANIIENAIKYTPTEGSITITQKQTEEYSIVAVQDTGVGISKQDLPYIFKRFWRGHTQVTEGNGLGLYISQQIINSQQGYILVQSKLNEGTCFQVFLPL